MENTDPNQRSQTQKDQTSDKQDAFRERMKALFEKLGTNGTELQDLYNSGDIEAVEERVDDMATSMLREDDEFISNMTSIRALRSSNRRNPGDEADLVSRNKELLKTYKGLIVMESGLPDEVRLGELESASQKAGAILAERGYTGGDPAEALHMLGFTDVVEGEIAYSFPESLMPDSVNEKWNIYLTSVIEHIKSTKELEQGRGSKDKVIEADRIRTYAHNSVTADVHKIHGLDGDKGWSLKDTRQLLADTRDYVLTEDVLASEEFTDKFCEDHHRGFIASSTLAQYKH